MYATGEAFDQLLQQLAALLGLEKLEKSGENVCTVATEDMIVSIINQSGTVILAANLGKLPQESDSAAIVGMLLRANVLYNATMGGCLGMTEEGLVSFCYQYPLSALTDELFMNIFTRFAEMTLFWQGTLERAMRGEGAGSEAQPQGEAAGTWDPHMVRV